MDSTENLDRCAGGAFARYIPTIWRVTGSGSFGSTKQSKMMAADLEKLDNQYRATGANMSSKSTKEKRRKIPTFTLKELEEDGKIPPYTNLMDPFDRWLLEKELEEAEQSGKVRTKWRF